jgi:hypothetical protein
VCVFFNEKTAAATHPRPQQQAPGSRIAPPRMWKQQSRAALLANVLLSPLLLAPPLACAGVCPIAPGVDCPPMGRPPHYYSCTVNLTRGGARLPYPFCNASLPLSRRLDDLLRRATYAEKAALLTSGGSAIPRLGVPRLGSGEDTHGIASGQCTVHCYCGQSGH